jgi:hypothetical protein
VFTGGLPVPSAQHIISHLTKSKEAPRYTVSHYTGLLLTDLLLNTGKNVGENQLKETSYIRQYYEAPNDTIYYKTILISKSVTKDSAVYKPHNLLSDCTAFRPFQAEVVNVILQI